MTKTILVTGANRGIGLEIVKQYSEDNNVVLACCRQPDKAHELQKLQKASDNIYIHSLDVSDENNIKQLAIKLKNTSIDILYNNAGIAGEDVPFEDMSYENFLATLKTNTIAPVMLAQALIPQIKLGKDKIIVNMSSLLGSIELNQEAGWAWFAYRVSKSALNSATRCMSNQLKSQKFITIAMSPGWVKTDMGGENAAITVDESVRGIKRVVSKLSLTDSGQFLSYDGKTLPW